MMTHRLISNSEVTTWATCKRKYWFEYVMDLEAKQVSQPITKGVLIHSMLETYYTYIAAGIDEDEARAAGMGVLMTYMAENASNTNALQLPTLGEIRTLVQKYFDFYSGDSKRYRPEAIEAQFQITLSPDFSLVGRLDLLWLDETDGRYIVVDHKSSYNFFSEAALVASPQFPKYIHLLREHGYDVKYALVNQLRTRQIKEGDLFVRAIVDPSPRRINAVLDQHVRLSDEIMQFRSQPRSIEETTPLFEKRICSECSFFDLCTTVIEGRNVNAMVHAQYMKRTSYGYNQETGDNND